VSCMVHDSQENMIYVGTWTVQAKVVSIASGDGGVPFSRIDCLNLDYAAGAHPVSINSLPPYYRVCVCVCVCLSVCVRVCVSVHSVSCHVC